MCAFVTALSFTAIFDSGCLQAALQAAPFACMEKIHNTPSPMAGLLALTSPPPDFLFSSIQSPTKPTIPPKKRNIPYWYCPLCTPSLTLPPSSLKCLQKSNPNIHRKCFRCFKCFGCFGCFISLLDHKTARFWSKSEQNRCFKCSKPAAPNQAANPQKRYFTV